MQRYFSNKLMDNRLYIDENDYYHIRKVMRMNDGDMIEVVYNHDAYICEIENVNECICAKIIEKMNTEVSELVKKVLIIPLLSEQKMDYIFQKATELGVNDIIPVRMKRCKIKIDSKKEMKKVERWNRICKEASEQSKRLDVPRVFSIKNIDELNNLEGLKIICSTSEKNNTIKKFLQNNIKCDRISVVMGPEGGFETKEEEKLIEYGFVPVSLGERILRAETVPLFILSIINYILME